MRINIDVNDRAVLDAMNRLRFIPAYTGNTTMNGERLRRYSVHPRVHGEHSGIHVGIGAPYGSSPRTRGTRERLTPKSTPLMQRVLDAAHPVRDAAHGARRWRWDAVVDGRRWRLVGEVDAEDRLMLVTLHQRL